MLETALEIAGDALPAATVRQILDDRPRPDAPSDRAAAGRERDAAAAGGAARLVLVTKGDLFHQESKLAASGLGDHFAGVEIVSEKTAETYAKVFARYGVEADEP